MAGRIAVVSTLLLGACTGTEEADPPPAAGIVTPGQSGSTPRGTDVATTGDDCPCFEYTSRPRALP